MASIVIVGFAATAAISNGLRAIYSQLAMAVSSDVSDQPSHRRTDGEKPPPLAFTSNASSLRLTLLVANDRLQVPLIRAFDRSPPVTRHRMTAAFQLLAGVDQLRSQIIISSMREPVTERLALQERQSLPDRHRVASSAASRAS